MGTQASRLTFKAFVTEATLKGTVDQGKIFSDLEQRVFSFLCDYPNIAADTLEERNVRIADLIPTQGKIDGFNSDNYDPILVVERDGKLYILDGHHRFARDKRSKQKEIAAYTISLPSKKVDLKWFSSSLGIKLKDDGDFVKRA